MILIEILEESTLLFDLESRINTLVDKLAAKLLLHGDSLPLHPLGILLTINSR